MPPQLLNAFCTTALLLGFELDPSRASLWLPAAILMRAGYLGVLRPREVGDLRVGRVMLPRGSLGVGRSIVSL